MHDLSILVGAALTCVLGGLLPWINAELVVVSAAFVLPPSAVPALALACAGGQMASKLAVYGLARWAPERLPGRARRLLARAERYRHRPRALALLALSGALVAVPPFYLVTLACGFMRVPCVLFTLTGFAGTATRYGVLAWLALALGNP
jgi:membrane protein YqaA with SNARE-associated domain